MTVFGDDLDTVGLDSSADKRVDVVVANFAHQAHLLHRLAADFVPLGEH